MRKIWLFVNDFCARRLVGHENMSSLEAEAALRMMRCIETDSFPPRLRIGFRPTMRLSRVAMKARHIRIRKSAGAVFPAALFAWFMIGGADGIHC